MKSILVALHVEMLKYRKSKIVYITAAIFVFIPSMLGFMMFVAQNPEMASKMGLVGTKANMFGQNNMYGFFTLVLETSAGIGLVGIGFVTAWIFGGEHTAHTFKDLLVLPISRKTIVFAKLLYVALFGLVLLSLFYAVSVAFASLLGLSGYSLQLLLEFTYRFFAAGILTILLSTPIAWLSGISKGVLAPIGFVIGTMILAQFAGILGLGPYFPWSIPGLFSIHKNEPGYIIETTSFLILFITCLSGIWATIRWWNVADHR